MIDRLPGFRLLMNWLDYLSTFSILFPFAAALLHFRLLNAELKLLGWLFIVSALIETYCLVTSQYRINNVWLLNIYNVLEGFVFFYICARWFQSGRLFRFIMGAFIVYVMYWTYSTFITGSLFEFNEKEKTLKGILLILISGYLLLHISKEETLVLTQDYRFWFTAAMLVYFSVGVALFSTANFVLEDNVKAMYYSWNVHSVINIICNLLYAYGFTWYYRRVNLSI
jgi:hypothetical protein